VSEDDDDYEYLFDILYTVFGVMAFVFFVMGIGAFVVVLISLL